MKKLVLTFAAGALMLSSALAGNGNLFSEDNSASDASYSFAKKKKGGDAFGEGAVVTTIGYGFPNLGKSLLKAFQDESNYKVGGVGPMHAKLDYGLSDKISIGLSLNFVSYSATWTDVTTESVYDPNTGNYTYVDHTYDYKIGVTSLSALVRLNNHFATTDKLDPYYGVGFGYRSTKYKEESNDPNWVDSGLSNAIPVGFEFTFGLRYYFTDNIGAYLEVGAAKSLMQGGIAAKF